MCVCVCVVHVWVLAGLSMQTSWGHAVPMDYYSHMLWHIRPQYTVHALLGIQYALAVL